jgi:NAD-dependent DNA ligase
MKIVIPDHCPACASKLELINSQLFCKNRSCEAQIYKKLEHFAKTLQIKGLGPKTIEKLDLSDLPEIFYLDLDTVKETLGEKTAVKLLDEIERSKSADLATVLASFSIPLIGGTAAAKIAKTVNSIEDITLEKCKQAGLGDKASQNLCNWLETDYLELKEFLPFSFKPVMHSTSNEAAKTVCITGKLSSYKTKADAYKELEAAGFRVVESVTKTLNYLVDEEDKGSSKRTKAEQYGVTIIFNLINFLKENQND